MPLNVVTELRWINIFILPVCLNKCHAVFFTFFSHAFRPYAGLYFAYMCLFRYSIHRRDCPIPPPMLSGSEPFRSLLWKYNSFRSSFPESSNWRNSASLSTRIPIDESSMARPSTSFHTRRSPLSPGSPVAGSIVE